MIWTVELAQYLDDAPWPATVLELVEYADRIGAPYEVIDNLKEAKENEDEDEEEIYDEKSGRWIYKRWTLDGSQLITEVYIELEGKYDFASVS